MKELGFLGGDVSKGRCDFRLLDKHGSEIESSFQLDDNKEGHNILLDQIERLRKTYGLSKIIVGIESTGGYENNWYLKLRKKSMALKIEVYRINPKRIFFESKIECAKNIDDGVSAYLIANHIRKNYGTGSLVPRRLEQSVVKDNGAKVLYKYIKQITKENVKTKNSLEKLLYMNMPELLALKKEKWSGWFLELLIKYPSKARMLKADIQGLTKIKHITEAKAKLILDVIKDSVGKRTSRIESMVIKSKAEDIKNTDKKLIKLKAELVKVVKTEKARSVEVVSSIKGLGEDTSVNLILEMPNIEHFENANSLVAFWGVNPTYKHSGDGKRKTGMSKDGSALARAELFIAAKNVVLHEPYFKALYHRYRSKGKSHYSTMGIIMSKLTRILFGMLKNDQEFDSGIDTFNQDKKPALINNAKPIEPNKIERVRRYQKTKSLAPVSRREMKKRKEQLS